MKSIIFLLTILFSFNLSSEDKDTLILELSGVLKKLNKKPEYTFDRLQYVRPIANRWAEELHHLFPEFDLESLTTTFTLSLENVYQHGMKEDQAFYKLEVYELKNWVRIELTNDLLYTFPASLRGQIFCEDNPFSMNQTDCNFAARGHHRALEIISSGISSINASDSNYMMFKSNKKSKTFTTQFVLARKNCVSEMNKLLKD